MTQKLELPRWDMTNVYPSLSSPEYQKDIEKFTKSVDELAEYAKTNHIDPDKPLVESDPKKLAKIIAGFLDRTNALLELGLTLQAYVYSFLSTNSYDAEANKAISSFQPILVRAQQIGGVIFTAWLAKLGEMIDEVIKQDAKLVGHAFFLKEAIDQSKYLMSTVEEELAGELSLSGGVAWSKLENDIVSQTSWEIEGEDGKVQKLPMTAIINLRNHPNEVMRRRGWEAEMAAWKSLETTFAASLNSIKGAHNVLNKRRGRQDAVHQSLDQSRIDRATLEAMLEAMKNSFPMFRKYFKAKAKRMGKESLAWWDTQSSLGESTHTFSYPEAQKFVLDNFTRFSEELADFANTAFVKNWIDVGPRDGKGPGAFCMSLPAVKETRILLNFEGNLDWVFTMAHELGHGYHAHCIFEADHSLLNSQTPMTLAETASIMCETIVTDAAIKQAANKDEELAILDTNLIGASQVVVDIYSRYLFEKEVFERRAKAELSADEFCEIMEWAQEQTYGDGLDPQYRHKYMWTWKSHYYMPDLAFYNYPYAFGLLFGTGLYAIYKERGDVFIEQYKGLLSSTGLGTAAELAARFDIDLRSPAFWEGSLNIIGERIDRFVKI